MVGSPCHRPGKQKEAPAREGAAGGGGGAAGGCHWRKGNRWSGARVNGRASKRTQRHGKARQGVVGSGMVWRLWFGPDPFGKARLGWLEERTRTSNPLLPKLPPGFV